MKLNDSIEGRALPAYTGADLEMDWLAIQTHLSCEISPLVLDRHGRLSFRYVLHEIKKVIYIPICNLEGK